MEHLGDDPSPTSDLSADKAGIRITAQCDDCGQEYLATATLALEAFTRKRQPHLCSPCRVKVLRQQELERLAVHEKVLAHHRDEWLVQSGIPRHYLEKGFGDFAAAGNEDRVSLLRHYADAFPMGARPLDYPSIIIASQNNGVGKTHLTCAILRTIIGRMEDAMREHCPYRFWTAPAVKQRVLDAQRFSSKETLQQVYHDFASMWLLAIDDVGKERLTGDFGLMYEIYFTIINDRYNAGLPLILTSNVGFEPWEPGGLKLEDLMGWAACSRLKEMTGSRQVVIHGDDRR